MGKYVSFGKHANAVAHRLAHLATPAAVLMLTLAKASYGAGVVLDVLPAVTQIQQILAQLGPALSAVLFVLAGVFYALGQLMPPEKKAQFHTTAVNIIIGAIVVGVLSVASLSLANVSSHLLNNLTVSANNTTN